MTIALSSSLRANLFSLLRTQVQIDQTQLRLASGKRVNTALDDPINFFTSTSLAGKAADLNRLLDGIGQSAQTVKTALKGLEGIEKLLEQAEALSNEALASESFASVDTLNELITSSNPVGYWRLDETSGVTATNLGNGGGALNGTYQAGVTQGAAPLYAYDGQTVADFDGVAGRVNIPNSTVINTTPQPERTIELVFQADSTGPRQVLYEEGGAVSALSIYVENGRVHVNGRDGSGNWGPFNISTEIEAGEVYHVALVVDHPGQELRGYLNGELIDTGALTPDLSAHPGGIGIGRMNGASYFHDGSQSGNGLAFDGRIGEVAIYNDVLSQDELEAHFNQLDPGDGLELAIAFDLLKEQIDELANDASYQSVNLLRNGTLETFFNEKRTSFLNTVGGDFTHIGLDLEDTSFATRGRTQASLEAVREAIDRIRSFSASLTADLNIIEVRQSSILEAANIHTEGSDKLTLADMNEEGAKMLALQTNQQLSLSALRIASQARARALFLFV